jgi:putative NADPH-quinone reductase
VTKILIIDGHPDPDSKRLCHALAASYWRGAREAGHEVRQITLSEMGIPPLTSRADWEKGKLKKNIQESQNMIAWAEHMVIIYPLWLGSMPAYLKAFFEQVFRPGFAIGDMRSGKPGLLGGKSAHIVVTMGMPSFVYKWYFRAHSVKSLERNILRFSGIKPIKESIIGSVESAGVADAWLKRMYEYGLNET